ncbi:hypothetical protein T06_14851 [Trichinella sp. T6]|nr:hypothetical protein T06_14851 [Trichinella sp. T6]
MFWEVLRQMNAYVSNKWLLKLPCAYLNTQESRPTGTPLKRIQSGKVARRLGIWHYERYLASNIMFTKWNIGM